MTSGMKHVGGRAKGSKNTETLRSSFHTEDDDEASSLDTHTKGSSHAPTEVTAVQPVRRDRARSYGFPSSDPQLDEHNVSGYSSSSHREDGTSQTKRPKPGARRGKSAVPIMMRELFPHNDGPEIGIDTELQSARLWEPQIRTTRNLLKKKSSAPKQKSLNVAKLFQEQLMDDKLEKASRPTPKKDKSRSRHCADRPLAKSSDKPLSDQMQDIDSSYAWLCWEKQKQKISKYLTSHSWNSTTVELPSLRLRRGSLTDDERDVEFSMEDGVFVLKPTPVQFDYFADLLKMVEELIGQQKGVMKVVLPPKRLLPHSHSFRRNGQPAELKPDRVTLSQDSSEKETGTYSLNSEEACQCPGAFFRMLVDKKKAGLLKTWDELNAPNSGDIWKHCFEWDPFTEARMLKCAGRVAPLVSVSEAEATAALRMILRCYNPGLSLLDGNRFRDSTTVQAGEKMLGISHPVFHISTRTGPMFPIQIGEFAGYTVNYHHCGAPRCYTVVEPGQHQRLEQMLCLASDPANPQAPPCSQFASHDPIYVPKDTLKLNDIAFTEVTQYQGEIIVIFPYAYYEGFNAGPNITEEIMYASEHWKVFHQKGLYVPCNKDCVEGVEEFDLGFARERSQHNGEDSDDEDADVLPSAEKRKRHKPIFSESESEDEVTFRAAGKLKRRLYELREGEDGLLAVKRRR